MTIFTLFFFTVLVANVEFAGFAPKQKYMDCCKILTKKEPMRTQGLGLPYIIKCNMAASLIKATFMILKRFEIFLVIQNPNSSSKLTKDIVDIYCALQGIGDNAPGFANFLLFCLFTEKCFGNCRSRIQYCPICFLKKSHGPSSSNDTQHQPLIHSDSELICSSPKPEKYLSI